MKGKFFIVFLLIIIMASVVAGIFLHGFLRKTGNAPGAGQEVPNEWKTYQNRQYGFEFQYPDISSYPLVETSPSPTIQYFLLGLIVDTGERNYFRLSLGDYGTIEEAVRNRSISGEESGSSQEVMIGGIAGRKIIIQPEEGGLVELTFWQRNGISYEASCVVTRSSVCSQILSTFRFI